MKCIDCGGIVILNDELEKDDNGDYHLYGYCAKCGKQYDLLMQ